MPSTRIFSPALYQLSYPGHVLRLQRGFNSHRLTQDAPVIETGNSSTAGESFVPRNVSSTDPLVGKRLRFPPQTATRTDSAPTAAPTARPPVFESLPRAKVTRTLEDGEELPYGGGTVVIHTPGHMPGHIRLYVKPAKVLVAGDALNVEDGRLIGPRPQYTANMDTALRSLRKLAHYDIETVICYHVGAYRGNANEHITELSKGQGER